MIFINLAFVILSTYLAATSESRLLIALNSAAVGLNVMAVVMHLLINGPTG
jgi:hypothetical protein